jgi:hypothetical protein
MRGGKNVLGARSFGVAGDNAPDSHVAENNTAGGGGR